MVLDYSFYSIWLLNLLGAFLRWPPLEVLDYGPWLDPPEFGNSDGAARLEERAGAHRSYDENMDGKIKLAEASAILESIEGDNQGPESGRHKSGHKVSTPEPPP